MSFKKCSCVFLSLFSSLFVSFPARAQKQTKIGLIKPHNNCVYWHIDTHTLSTQVYELRNQLFNGIVCVNCVYKLGLPSKTTTRIHASARILLDGNQQQSTSTFKSIHWFIVCTDRSACLFRIQCDSFRGTAYIEEHCLVKYKYCFPRYVLVFFCCRCRRHYRSILSMFHLILSLYCEHYVCCDFSYSKSNSKINFIHNYALCSSFWIKQLLLLVDSLPIWLLCR